MIYCVSGPMETKLVGKYQISENLSKMAKNWWNFEKKLLIYRLEISGAVNAVKLGQRESKLQKI